MNSSERKVILDLIESGAKKRNDWPGAPLGHIPLLWQETLNAMVAAGEVTIVSRPAKVDPSATRSYVVRTG